MADKIEKRSVSVAIDNQEVINSLKAISKEIAATKAQVERLSEGTDSYIAKALQLAKATEAAKENRKSIADIALAYQRMPDDVRKSVDAQVTQLKRLQQEYATAKTQNPNGANVTMLGNEIKQMEARLSQTVAVFSRVEKAGIDTFEGLEEAIKEENAALKKLVFGTEEYEAAVKRLSALNSTLSEHKKHLNEVEKAGIDTFEGLEEAIKEENAALKKLVFGTEEYEAAVKRLANLNNTLSEHKKKLGDVEEGWQMNIPSVKEFAAVAVGAFAVDKVVEYIGELHNLGVEIDSINIKAASVLAEHLGKINAEAEKHKQSFGIARQEYVGATTEMAAFYRSQFATREESVALGNQTVKLAGVLAGFKGGGAAQFQEALEAIKGGFADDVEELAKFNIALSENTIEAAMAERGIDKLNAKQQEHAKALVLLQLIQEKATAQQDAFAAMQEGSAARVARLTATLKEIGYALAEILLPVFERVTTVVAMAIQPIAQVVDGLKKMSGEQSVVAQRAAAMTKRLENESMELSVAVNRITGYNEGNKTRKALIDELQVQYPFFLKNLDKEKVTNEQLQQQLQKVNKEYLNKAIAIKASEEVGKMQEAEQKTADKNAEKRIAAAKALAQAQKTFGFDNVKNISDAMTAIEQRTKLNEQEIAQIGAFGDRRRKESLQAQNEQLRRLKVQIIQSKGEEIAADTALENAQKNTNTALKEREQLIRNLAGGNEELYKTYMKILDPPEDKAPNLSGMSEDQRKQLDDKLKAERDNLKKLQEAIAAHRADVRQQNLRDDERDIEAIREKYRKDIELSLELEKSKQKKVAEGAKAARLELEKIQADEITAKMKENTEKRVAALKEIETRHLGEMRELKEKEIDKELRAAENKYQKELETIRKIAAESPKNAEVQAQARAAELAATEAHEAAKQAILDKYGKEYLAKLNAFLAEVDALEADDDRNALLKLEQQYNELLKKAQEYGESDLKIQKWYKAAKQAIIDEQKNKAIDTAKKQAEEEQKIKQKQHEQEAALVKARIDVAQSMYDFLDTVLSASAKKSAAFIAFQKGIAIAEVVMNTWREIASIGAIYGGTAPPLATKLIIAAKIKGAIGVATIAAQGIQEYKAAQQKADGGYVEIFGANDGKRYNAKNGGATRTGMVYDPTVFLVGEKPEYVIANPELEILQRIAPNFLPFIEAMRERRMGISSSTPPSVSSANTAASTPSVSGANVQVAAQPQNENLMLQMLQMLQKLDTTLNGGIYAAFTRKDAFELKKLQREAEEISGYEA